MWKCRHCGQEFEFYRSTEKANHSRHCNSNPKKVESYTKQKDAQNRIIERELGKLKEYPVNCYNCDLKFMIIEREKQHQ